MGQCPVFKVEKPWFPVHQSCRREAQNHDGGASYRWGNGCPSDSKVFWKSLENHVDFHGMTGSWTLRKIWTYHSLKMSIELTTSSRIYYSYPFLHPFRYVSISADDLESPTATDWGAIEAAVLSELDARSLCSLEGDSDGETDRNQMTFIKSPCVKLWNV